MKYCCTTTVVLKSKQYTDATQHTQQTDNTVGLGALPLFCRGRALRGRDDHLTHPLQTARTLQCRHHPLHLVALSALGHQAPVESLCGHPALQALVDCGHATAHRGGLGRRGLHHSRTVVAARLAVLLLADGLRQCHPRHCRRRLLYARSRRARTGVLRWHPFYLLPHRHHRGIGTAGGTGRCTAGTHAQHHLCLELSVLFHGRTLHRPVALPQLGTAASR